MARWSRSFWHRPRRDRRSERAWVRCWAHHHLRSRLARTSVCCPTRAGRWRAAPIRRCQLSAAARMLRLPRATRPPPAPPAPRRRCSPHFSIRARARRLGQRRLLAALLLPLRLQLQHSVLRVPQSSSSYSSVSTHYSTRSHRCSTSVDTSSYNLWANTLIYCNVLYHICIFIRSII